MLQRIVPLLVFLLITTGVYYFLTDTRPIISKPIPSPVAQNLSTTFSGTLPCADCPGIDAEITFTKTNSEATSGSYIEKDIYQDRNNNQPVTTVGKWMIMKGTATDPNATVYVLNPDQGSQPIYYLLIDNNTIKQLDSDKKEIDAPFNFTLTKK